MLVKIVLCWMSVIHSQTMKYDKLRGKTSKIPLKGKLHLRRDSLAPTLNIWYTKVRQSCTSDTLAGFSSFSVFIVWQFPCISVEYHISPEPLVKHLGLQLQLQLHGLFFQYQGLTPLTQELAALTAVVLLSSISEKKIHLCHHQGHAYA